MAQTVLTLYNQALSSIRAKGRLSSLTENSREREECDIWYSMVRDVVQEAAYWESCRQTARLTLLATRNSSAAWVSGDPETQYLYSYAYPANCLRPWHLVGYEPFTISFDPTRERKVINTNVKDAILIFAALSENPGHWSAAQFNATLLALAGYIAGPISGNNSLQSLNINLANNLLLSAQSQSANTPTFMPEMLSPGLQARGYEDYNQTRFYYPHGALFSGANPNG